MSRKLFLLLLLCAICRENRVEGRFNRSSRPTYKAAPKNKHFELTILHINDLFTRSVTCNKNEEFKCTNGSALLATTQKILKEHPNSVFFHAGDHRSGSIVQDVNRSNVSMKFLNDLPLDAMTLGNHDLDDKISDLVPFLKRLRVPIVLTNIDSSQEKALQECYQNSTIIKKGNKKIGIIGVISQANNSLSNAGKLKFLDVVKTINAEAIKLKIKGANIIIVLSHSGLDVDKIIAAKSPNVDVIIDGHATSNFFNTEKSISNNKTEDTYPIVINQKQGRNVLIVRPLSDAKYLGNLTVWFDRRGEAVEWEGHPILLDNSIKDVETKLSNDNKKIIRSKFANETEITSNKSCNFKECT